MCLKTQVPQLMFKASHHRQKAWKSLGRRRRRRGGSELGAVRLEAVKGGKMQEVLLSRGLLCITGRDGNCSNSFGKTPNALSQSHNLPRHLARGFCSPASSPGSAPCRACCGEAGVSDLPETLLRCSSPPAAPHFPEPLGDTAVEVGESVSLLCRVEGSPPPRVTWSRQDGKPVTGWHGPRGVSSELEAAELFIDSKRAERASVCWRGGEHMRASHLGACLRSVTRGCSPLPAAGRCPSSGISPHAHLSAAVKH